MNSRTYGRTILRSRLWPGAARDDERLPVAEPRLERRELDALGEEASLVAEVAHRVVRELLEGLGHAAALLGERPRELFGAERPSGGELRPVREEQRPAHGEPVAVAHLVEQVGARRVDQADAATNERERPGIRKAPGLRLRDIDHDAHPGLEQLLRRHAVEIGVVDDGDVVWAQAGGRGASCAGRAALSP